MVNFFGAFVPIKFDLSSVNLSRELQRMNAQTRIRAEVSLNVK